jgi:hypothetical protein
MSALIIPLAISPQYECARANIRAGLDEAVCSDQASIRPAGKPVRVLVPFVAPFIPQYLAD